MAASYYEPLDKSKPSIRLLKVFPGGPDELIRCELTHVNLDERPDYIALSYTWDKSGETDDIECCGRFRAWNGSRDAQLWIDAICINQNDVRERNHQFAQMRALYSKAELVIAWIGELTVDEGRLAHLIVSNESAYHKKKVSAFTTLKNILSKSYWNRVWIIQEVLLPRSLDIWLGEYRIESGKFREFIRGFAESQKLSAAKRLLFKTPGRIVLEYREHYWASRGPSTSAFELWELLKAFPGSESSLVHDNVYGLLGLTNDAKNSEYPITPDYSKSRVDLLVDVLCNQYGKGRARHLDVQLSIENLRRSLTISCLDLTRYVLGNRPDTDRHIFALALDILPVANLKFIDAVDFLSVELSDEIRTATRREETSLHLILQDLAGLVEEPTRMRALKRFLLLGSKRWPRDGVNAIHSSIDSLVCSLKERKHRLRCPGPRDCHSTSVGKIASTMARGIMEETRIVWASLEDDLAMGNIIQHYENAITYYSPNDDKPGWMRIAVFSGATQAQNALVLSERTARDGTLSYCIVGFAFLLRPESQCKASPFQNFDLSYPQLEGLLRLSRMEVLKETQLATLLEDALLAEEMALNEGHMSKSSKKMQNTNYRNRTILDRFNIGGLLTLQGTPGPYVKRVTNSPN